MKILYVRSGPYQVNPNSYNLQELGLASAFKELGIDCDVMYYHKSRNYDEYIPVKNIYVKILWRTGIRLLRSGIYLQILRDNFLRQYDCVICSEYSQIMSVLLLKQHNNVYIYNGPYYSLFKLGIIEPIYDFLFCNYINKNAKKIFCKTEKSKNFLGSKGITNTKVVGVGLDSSKFDNEAEIEDGTQNILSRMNKYRNILYVGQIIKRKNVETVVKTFVELIDNGYDDIQLVMVGKGDEDYIRHCKSLVPERYKNRIVWVDFIKNSQLRFIYEHSSIFMLPSVNEIFGMVLLEAMYFGVPTISSRSAGGETLIENNVNGILCDYNDLYAWEKAAESILNDEIYARTIGINARNTILQKYNWNSIASSMLEDMEK